MKNQTDIFGFAMMVFMVMALLFGGQSDAAAKLAEMVTVGMMAYMRGADANGK